MSDQMLHHSISPAVVERNQQSAYSDRESVLDKLHEDSQMTAWQKVLKVGTVVSSESATRGPISSILAIAGPNIGLAVAGLAVMDTTLNSHVAVKAVEIKKESALIKEHFGANFPSGAVAKIEADCTPSSLRKIGHYVAGTASEAAIGFGSGVVLSPVTAGYSIPALTVGGAGVGYLNAARALDVGKYGCEVDKMKAQIRSW